MQTGTLPTDKTSAPAPSSTSDDEVYMYKVKTVFHPSHELSDVESGAEEPIDDPFE